MATGIKPSKVCPKFLHSNSTSHTWVFSAIAELIDNACDTDVRARDLWIDKETINNTECLTFLDNGCGMTPDKLHKMLSFGFSEKEDVGKQLAIGRYGNGFKSGSMRIGQDALVITRGLQSMSVGFLSQSYLNAIKADTVLIPVVTWDITPGGLTRKRSLQNIHGIKAILEYSIFKSEVALTTQLDELGSKPGTKIIIYNLRKDSTGNLELDFVSDPEDIRNPETEAMDPTVIYVRNRPAPATTPEYRRSLREYCSILYLRPRMRIIVRKKKVATKLIEKSLRKREVDIYNPQWNNVRLGLKLTFGYTKDKSPYAPYGLMTYHNNRLIKGYEKIGIQKKATGEGYGIIAVAEVNFLEPIQNKQDFKLTGQYNAFMNNAAKKLRDYYEEKTQTEDSAAETIQQAEESWNWVQCDNCRSFRRLPGDYDMDRLPDKWYCKNNPDPLFNRCEIPEELEGEDEEKIQPKPTYTKTVQKKKAEKKRQEKLEEEKKAKEKEEALKVAKEKEEELLRAAAEEAKQKEEALKTAREKEEALKAVSEESRKKEEALEKAAKEKDEALKAAARVKEEALKEIEKQKKAVEKHKKALDYINPDKASEEKEKGNALFKQGKYSEALIHYNEAIKRNPKDAKLHSNRAACYTKLQAFSAALAACDDCLAIDPKFIKGYLHKGNILKNMNNSEEAVQAYEKALQINPNCTEAIRGFRASKGDESSVGMAGDEFGPSLDTSPDNTEFTPGKRKYQDRDGSGERVTRAKISEDGNNKVTTLPFGGYNFERSPAKRNSPKKTFPKPGTGAKSSPRTGLKRIFAEASTSGTSSEPSSSATPSAIHSTPSHSGSNEIVEDVEPLGASPYSFNNGGPSVPSTNYTISSTNCTEQDSSPVYNGTSGPASTTVPTVCVEVSNPVETGTKTATCRTALNFDNIDSNLNKTNLATNNADALISAQDNLDELPDIDNGYTEMEADTDKKPEEGELEKTRTEMDTDKNPDEGELEKTRTEMDTDKKPDEGELEKMLTEMDKVLNDTKTDEIDEKKVFQHKESQTVPTVVKYASPSEVELLKLCPTEQRQTLLLKARELDELRRNILTLMKILQPEYEYGPPENVDSVIKEFIKANNDQNNSH